MAGFIIFVLAVFGLVNAITVLKVGKPLRWLSERIPPWYWVTERAEGDTVKHVRRSLANDIFSCPACLSFWVGMIFSGAFWSPAAMWVADPIKAMFIDGLAASTIAWILHVGIEAIIPSHI